MSVGNEEVVRLLSEIRDQQREQITLSRAAVEHAQTQAKVAMEAAERSIANQQKAIATQDAVAKLYRRVVLVAIPVVVLLVVAALALLVFL